MIVDRQAKHVLPKTERITNMDVFLVEAKLDVAEALAHPVLLQFSENEICTNIDKIYAAANLGSTYARLLIHEAAIAQAREAAQAAADLEPVQDIIDLSEMNYRIQSQESAPLDAITAAAEIGCILMRAETASEEPYTPEYL